VLIAGPQKAGSTICGGCCAECVHAGTKCE